MFFIMKLCLLLLAIDGCVSSSSRRIDSISLSGTSTWLEYVIKDVFLVPSIANVCNYLDYNINNITNNNQLNVNNDNEDGNNKNVVENIEEKNFVHLYHDGIKSYLANDWEQCVEDLEKSLNGYRDYYEAITSCRIECDFKQQRQKEFFGDNIENFHFYEAIVRKTLCLEKCKRILLPNLPAYFFLDLYAKQAFMERKTYEYLQLCYYRTGDLVKAASATFTSILKNPNSTMMRRNLQFYVENIKNFNKSMVVDYEEKRFAKSFLNGLQAYEQNNWTLSIEYIEHSLQQFIYDNDECRAFCEGEFDQGWHTDFISSTANHFTYSLRCKENCTRDLAVIRGTRYENIFRTHYEYLHISYYKDNNIKDACRAAVSYLLMHPTSIEMQENLEFYQSQMDINTSSCSIRNEAKRYHQIQQYERSILAFVDKEFVLIASTAHDLFLNRD